MSKFPKLFQEKGSFLSYYMRFTVLTWKSAALVPNTSP